MGASTQLNTRIDSDLKREGDAVFRRAGLTPSEVVRGVWSYAAEHQEVPDFLRRESGRDDGVWTRLVDEGAGLALKLARGEATMPDAASGEDVPGGGADSWCGREENDMYEEKVDEYERLLQD